MRVRRVPLRKCVACQENMPKKQLIRIVRTPESEVLIDITGKKSGRGAYLCGKVSCFKLAKKNRSLDRALKVAVGEQVYDTLAQEFIRVEDEFRAYQATQPDEEEEGE
ncbi:RNase P modulator RnpM [Paenibacillus alkalitolerans]|uniref:RNase P modulator RnpM n=1 Tax=Paenibacillus alkalitolerans TaxID=2799335 RepID=UPI0018F43E00|nr:YlxR family protein [Paenibacillus alkalitolerans]